MVIGPAGPRHLLLGNVPYVVLPSARDARMTRETGGVLTHLGLEPLRELGPEPVELQAHFCVHADAHVVVHHLRLHLHTTGMSAVEQEKEP